MIDELLEGHAAVTSLAPIRWLNHHADGHVGAHEGLQVVRVEQVTDASDDFVVLLVQLEHLLGALAVCLAVDAYAQRNIILFDVPVEVLLDLLDAEGNDLLAEATEYVDVRVIVE